MINVILIGAGGHSKVIQDIVKSHTELTLHAVLDQNFKDRFIDNDVIYGHTDLIGEFVRQDFYFCIAIGNNKVRETLVKKLPIPNNRYISLIHPTATISSIATIGIGTVVMPQSVINADTVIGDHVIINSRAVVEHDNIINDFVHISPNATLAGTVTVEKGTHIGS